jgi:hypothetical protein
MLAYSDALAAAHQHLWSRLPPPEWVWRLPVGERVAGGWYFACSLEPLRLAAPEQRRSPTEEIVGGTGKGLLRWRIPGR